MSDAFRNIAFRRCASATVSPRAHWAVIGGWYGTVVYEVGSTHAVSLSDMESQVCVDPDGLFGSSFGIEVSSHVGGLVLGFEYSL